MTTRPPDQADAQLVASVLDAGADQRKRAAVRAAEAVDEARAAGKDPRSASVRVTRVLAEAGRLETLAKGLRDGTITLGEPIPGIPATVLLDPAQPTGTVAVISPPAGEPDPEDVTGLEPDGLSTAAHAAADAAGLTPTVIDGPEDPVTGATPEDDPDDDDVDEVQL